MTLDLDAYLNRIGFDGPRTPTAATLWALHEAQAAAIPFENLAIQLGELPLGLDLATLQDKLVRRRRGGYCFEQNLLFAAVLEAIGFRVRRCEARVRLGATRVLPRTHLVLVVAAEEGDVLCDVGFGGDGLLWPVPIDGAAHAHPDARLRVTRDGDLLVAQAARGPAWSDLYAFEGRAVSEADWQVANWYTSTHPESRFVTTLTVQRVTRARREVLRGLTYTRSEDGRTSTREVLRADLVPFLRERFGLELPPDAHFRALDGAVC
jgi:N-hydroxyarylamine O-acetyltransferase